MLCPPYLKKGFPNPNASEAYWNNVSLLMHYDGANNSTLFTETKLNLQFTRVAPAVISTVKSVFGGASFATNATGRIHTSSWYEALYLPADFTIECFVNASTLSGAGWVATLGEGYGIGYPMWTLARSGSTMYFSSCSADATASVIVGQAFGTVVLNTWHHVAVTRQGNTYRFFFDGILMATVTASATPYRDTNKRFSIGGDNAGWSDRFFSGFIDEMRITKGVARYTASFAVPILPFVHANT